MSDFHRVYYWANLIINPLLLLMLLVTQGDSGAAALFGWVTLSAILNPKIRRFVAPLGASIGAGIAALGCWMAGLSSLVTIIASIFVIALVAGILGTILVLALDVILWAIAFTALRNDGRGIAPLP